MPRVKIAIAAAALLFSAPAPAATSVAETIELQIALCEASMTAPVEDPGKTLDAWMVKNGWSIEQRIETMTICIGFTRGVEFAQRRRQQF